MIITIKMTEKTGCRAIIDLSDDADEQTVVSAARAAFADVSAKVAFCQAYEEMAADTAELMEMEAALSEARRPQLRLVRDDA